MEKKKKEKKEAQAGLRLRVPCVLRVNVTGVCGVCADDWPSVLGEARFKALTTHTFQENILPLKYKSYN